MNDGLSETELLRRVRARDKNALASLYDRYQSSVFGLALYVLGSRESAEEVLQDVFLFVWNRPDAWDPARGAFSTWLLAIVRYRAIDRLRGREGRVTRHEISLELTPELSQETWVEEARSDDGRMMRGLLEKLPREQSDLIEMAFYKGMTHSAIAAATGIALGTVKSRLRAGLHALRTLWVRETEVMNDE